MISTSSMTRRTALLSLAACAAAIGPGCASRTNPPNPVYAPISFPGPPIPLLTDRIEVTVRPRTASDVSPADADFVVPPEQIARLWPRQRLAAAGGQYAVRYVIDDASAVSRTTDGGEVIVATIQVRLLITTPYGIEEAGTGARVDSELRFEGYPSLIEKQEALHRMSQELAVKLDQQLSQSVRQTLARYITAPGA